MGMRIWMGIYIVGYFSPPWFGFVWNMLTHQFSENIYWGNHRDFLLGTWWNISATIWYLGLSENWVLFSQHCNLNDENDNQTNPFGKWFDRKKKNGIIITWPSACYFCLPSISVIDWSVLTESTWVNWCDDTLSAFLKRNGSVSKPCTPGEHQNSW